MKSVIIRADSSSAIGTGHIMRDLVLAEQFKDKKIIFATRKLPGNINHKIEEAGYEIAPLASNSMDELTSIAKQNNADMIILDHYGIDETEEKRLKEKTGATIFVLDDTYEKHHCDILLNHNVYADTKRYKGLVPDYCELRCGPEFTLLRNEFIEAKKKRIRHPLSIVHNQKLQAFIAMGGTDHSNINIDILKALEKFENIHSHIVTTTANCNLDALKDYVADKKNVTLHINTNKVANLMASSDFAIVTPSVTM
ncbi:UDP-2,4-diacetamido-2,4,6-trideoxy-beta-L-altropyranose hydrolase, partial [Hydrogenimonas sp.]